MLGKIISVSETEVLVKLGINIYDVGNLVGKLVVIDDNNKIVGEVTKISDMVMSVALLGEIVKDKYIYGINSKPSFNSGIRMIRKEELDVMYKIDEDNNLIRLGYSYNYKNYPMYIDVNAFFSNHFAILGNTGSGKSYALAKIIQSIFYDAKRLPFRTNIFLFDAYGEYERAFEQIGSNNENINYKVYTSNTKSKKYDIISIPFWLLSSDDIALLLEVDDLKQINIIEQALKLVGYFTKEESLVLKQKSSIIAKCILEVIEGGENTSFIRNKVLTILTKYNTSLLNLDITLSEPGWNRTLKQCLYLENNGKFANIELIIKYLGSLISNDYDLELPNGSILYTINDFAYALEFALMNEGIFNSEKVYDYANILKIRLNNLINSDYSKYFQYDRYVTKDEYVKKLLTTKEGRKAQVINFNISYINDRFAKNIVKIYSKILFDFVTKLDKRASFPIHIVLEEAHRYIQNDRDKLIIGYNIFDRIAKEGRKYGILLGVISQRPSEVSETVISQCSNFLVFKMFHPKDLLFIEGVISNTKNNIVNNLKVLPPGICLCFGNSFKMPTSVKMDKPNPTPMSDNCNINNTWYL